jgi:tight adherence protein B
MLEKYVGYILLAVGVFMFSYHYNKRFLDWLRFQSIGTRDYISERLSQMFIDIPPDKILLGQIILSFAPAFAVFIFMIPNWSAGFFFFVLTLFAGWKAPKPIVNIMYQRRVDKFVNQMVDGLSLMSNGLKSGLSVVQSIGLVTEEMPNPIRQEYGLVLSQNKLGVPLEEALINLSKRVVSDDVEMFVTAVNILKETGGNLAETFDTIVVTIRERIKVENKISAMTSQQFYQGMVLLFIPPALALVFYLTDPEFMAPVFTDVWGLVIVGFVVGLMIAAYITITKIVKVEV